MIPYAHQWISDEDVEAVVETLRSDWITQGPAVPRFEEAVASRVGAPHAVACSSGTAALHLAILAADMGPGSLVWTSPITFVASANCAQYVGADVDFVDIDPDTWNISLNALERKLAAAERASKLPTALVAVHFTGQPCDTRAIGELGRRYGFTVIEDAAHALGALDGGEKVGACAWSDMTTMSFHPAKVVTTGEGGLVTARSEELDSRLRLFRSHGITRDEAEMEEPPDGPWSYEQVGLGLNYRMTDFQAALGVSQMGRLDAFLARRRELVERYDALLADLPVTPVARRQDATSAWHLYVLRVHVAAGRSRREVYEAMRKAGIGVNVHYRPVHLQPYYRRLGFAPGDFPEAEAYYAEAITLPLYPAMTDEQQDQVVAALVGALS